VLLHVFGGMCQLRRVGLYSIFKGGGYGVGKGVYS
jgi:hypothetical protein